MLQGQCPETAASLKAINCTVVDAHQRFAQMKFEPEKGRYDHMTFSLSIGVSRPGKWFPASARLETLRYPIRYNSICNLFRPSDRVSFSVVRL